MFGWIEKLRATVHEHDETREPPVSEGSNAGQAGSAVQVTGRQRFLSARVSREEFVDIKTAALRDGVTLGEYFLRAHRMYQARERPD
jgi:hypothetical protein